MMMPLLMALVLLVCMSATTFNAYADTTNGYGTLQVLKLAEQSGNPLSGALFGVYRASDNTKLIDLTTNADGEASQSLESGEYYLRELKPPYGYLLERARIFFTVRSGVLVKVEVTNQRDFSIKDINTPGGVINLPKTGEDFPLHNYVIAILLIASALTCCVWVFFKRKIVFK